MYTKQSWSLALNHWRRLSDCGQFLMGNFRCSLTKGDLTKYHQNINTFGKYQQNINNILTKYQQFINLKNSINILSMQTSTKRQHINLLSTQMSTKNQFFVMPFCSWWNIYFMIMPPIWIGFLVTLQSQPDINNLSTWKMSQGNQ